MLIFLKWCCLLAGNAIGLGIERIILKNGKMICYFVADQKSPFYQSKAFISMVQFVSKSSYNGKMKEQNQKLTLTFPNIQNIEMADFLLKEIKEFIEGSR